MTREDLEDPRYWAGAVIAAAVGLWLAFSGRIPSLVGVLTLLPLLGGLSALGTRRRAERRTRTAERDAARHVDDGGHEDLGESRRLPQRWAYVERVGLGRWATLAVFAVMVASVVGYLPLLSVTTGDQFVIAPIGLFATMSAVHYPPRPWWWLLPLAVTGLGAALIGLVFPFEHGLLVWLASCGLGAVVGAGTWLVGLGKEQAPAPVAPLGRDGPRRMAAGPLREWAQSYGVPLDVLDPERGRPDDPSTYAVERRGPRWRAVHPARPGSADRPHGRWRDSEEEALADLYSALAHAFR